jgi:malonyl-CoA/methylmalonyl-CoA synthetase
MKMADNYLFDGLLAGKLDSEDRRNALFAILPDDGRRYSYGDVEDVSGRFANVLVDLGVRPGDRVAVQAPKSIEAIMLYLAVVRAGAVFLPLNTGYTPAEIEYFLGNATPRIFVCDPKQLADYEALDLAAFPLHLRHHGPLQGRDADAGQPAVERRDAGDYWRFTATTCCLHALPIFHTHGLFVATNIMLLAGGASMIFLPKFDADR